MYRKSGNARENLNGKIHPGGMFSQKKIMPSEVLPFSSFCQNGRYFLYPLCQALMSRSSERFTGILYMAQLNLIPFFGAKKKNASDI